MKEVLEAVKTLQSNQVQLAANVEAIQGRVNVLAGIQEVRDVASDPSSKPSTASKRVGTSSTESTNDLEKFDDAVPSSPSLPATQLEGSTQISHARKPSSTSRIILTCVPIPRRC